MKVAPAPFNVKDVFSALPQATIRGVAARTAASALSFIYFLSELVLGAEFDFPIILFRIHDCFKLTITTKLIGNFKFAADF